MPKYLVSRNFVTKTASYTEGQEAEFTAAEANRLIAGSKADYPDKPDLLVKVEEKEAKKANK